MEFPRLEIELRFVDIDSKHDIESHIDAKTKAMYVLYVRYVLYVLYALYVRDVLC